MAATRRVGRGSVTIEAGYTAEANSVSIGVVVGNPVPTLDTFGMLTTNALFLGNALLNGTTGSGAATIITGQLTQDLTGGGSETSVSTELGGQVATNGQSTATGPYSTLTVTVTGGMTVGGDGDLAFTIDQNATLIAEGASTVFDGIMTGAGTLENGTSSDTTAVMTFTFSGLNDAPRTNPFTDTFINYGGIEFVRSTNGTNMVLAGNSIPAPPDIQFDTFDNNGVVTLGGANDSEDISATVYCQRRHRAVQSRLGIDRGGELRRDHDHRDRSARDPERRHRGYRRQRRQRPDGDVRCRRRRHAATRRHHRRAGGRRCSRGSLLG